MSKKYLIYSFFATTAGLESPDPLRPAMHHMQACVRRVPLLHLQRSSAQGSFIHKRSGPISCDRGHQLCHQPLWHALISHPHLSFACTYILSNVVSKMACVNHTSRPSRGPATPIKTALRQAAQAVGGGGFLSQHMLIHAF